MKWMLGGCRGEVDYAAFCNGEMQWFAVYVRALMLSLSSSPACRLGPDDPRTCLSDISSHPLYKHILH